MARKSDYDRLADAVSKRLADMSPDKCRTTEEALQNDQKIAELFGMEPASAEDYSYCPTCARVCWHGVCPVCD